MKHCFLTFVIILFLNLTQGFSQATPTPYEGQNPKLVVGIVVDQMRYDYLTRFWERYGQDGFRRMLREGYNCKNNHFNYVPTYTGPGHASVYTGATPSTHGIVGNDWYSRQEKKRVYCAGDEKVTSVGTNSSAGKMSPHRMLVTSVADENRIHTQMRGKTIGIAVKDRGAILPAGHTANAAYWYHGKDEGKFISSRHYMRTLPKWVQDFNASGVSESYLKIWNPMFPIESYTASGTDENSYEGGFKGQRKATFPYDLRNLKNRNDGYDIIKETPFGNSITVDFAIAAIDGEALGQDDYTDFLAVSFSSTDYVGHNFGVNSVEVEDTYLRLDKDLERFFKALDEKVGKGNYTVFLTADHAGVHVPAFLAEQRIPAGYFDFSDFKKYLNDHVERLLGVKGLIEEVFNNQIFFNYEVVVREKLDVENLEKMVARMVLQYDRVDKVFTRSQMQNGSHNKGPANLVQNGFHQKRSGDVIVVLEPSYISYSRTGSTHGSGFNYDTHVPLLFFGKGIRQGSTNERTEITDIAPTIAALLGISFPNAAVGNPLPMVLEH